MGGMKVEIGPFSIFVPLNDFFPTGFSGQPCLNILQHGRWDPCFVTGRWNRDTPHFQWTRGMKLGDAGRYVVKKKARLRGWPNELEFHPIPGG